jgi:hypothetical protein
MSRDLTILVAVMTLLGLVIWGTAGRWSTRAIASLGLLVSLLGAFYLYIAFAPMSSTNAIVATGLFVGAAVLFRLLSTFEQ